MESFEYGGLLEWLAQHFECFEHFEGRECGLELFESFDFFEQGGLLAQVEGRFKCFEQGGFCGCARYLVRLYLVKRGDMVRS